MPPERDLIGDLVDLDDATDPQPVSVSEWLTTQDVRHLAEFARAARLSRTSFMAHVLDRG